MLPPFLCKKAHGPTPFKLSPKMWITLWTDQGLLADLLGFVRILPCCLIIRHVNYLIDKTKISEFFPSVKCLCYSRFERREAGEGGL